MSPKSPKFRFTQLNHSCKIEVQQGFFLVMHTYCTLGNMPPDITKLVTYSSKSESLLFQGARAHELNASLFYWHLSCCFFWSDTFGRQTHTHPHIFLCFFELLGLVTELSLAVGNLQFPHWFKVYKEQNQEA